MLAVEELAGSWPEEGMSVHKASSWALVAAVKQYRDWVAVVASIEVEKAKS